MIDYKELLEKYISHVKDCEGVDFIEYGDNTGSEVKFTEDELSELKRISLLNPCWK